MEWLKLAADCDAQLGTTDANAEISLEVFGDVSPAALLEAFIKVRQCAQANKRGEYKLPPRKGDLAKARECLAVHAVTPLAPLGKIDCTIYRAWKYQSKPIKMEPLSDEVPDAEPTYFRGSGPRRHPVVADAGLLADVALPSTYLQSSQWIQAACKGEFVGANFSREISVEMECNADALYSLVMSRLWQHKRSRLRDEKLYGHWAIQVFEENLPRLCALRVLGGSVKSDLKLSRHNACYLANCRKGNFVVTAEANQDLFGSYLFWDEEDSIWIRSGKAYSEGGRTIGVRNKEHVEGSKLRGPKTSTSQFYRCYPCQVEAAESISDAEKRGYHQNLVNYIGLAFDPMNSDTLTSNGDAGLFIWSDVGCQKLRASSDKCNTLVSSKLNMVSYMTEKLDDLMIPDDNNVSGSFGFETYGLYFA